MTSYDENPYPSYCYAATDPSRLRAIGTMFGLELKNVANAKILDIGCASGGNILPLASRYPESQFFGIDLSSVQIDAAKRMATEL